VLAVQIAHILLPFIRRRRPPPAAIPQRHRRQMMMSPSLTPTMSAATREKLQKSILSEPWAEDRHVNINSDSNTISVYYLGPRETSSPITGNFSPVPWDPSDSPQPRPTRPCSHSYRFGRRHKRCGSRRLNTVNLLDFVSTFLESQGSIFSSTAARKSSSTQEATSITPSCADRNLFPEMGGRSLI
jgi:hypothetical protein